MSWATKSAWHPTVGANTQEVNNKNKALLLYFQQIYALVRHRVTRVEAVIRHGVNK